MESVQIIGANILTGMLFILAGFLCGMIRNNKKDRENNHAI